MIHSSTPLIESHWTLLTIYYFILPQNICDYTTKIHCAVAFAEVTEGPQGQLETGEEAECCLDCLCLMLSLGLAILQDRL